jgi:predicted DNA-binding protein
MGNTITIRLPEDLAQWLDSTAAETGMPKGRIVREQLQRARDEKEPSFLRLAGKVSRASNLSTRKGYSTK